MSVEILYMSWLVHTISLRTTKKFQFVYPGTRTVALAKIWFGLESNGPVNTKVKPVCLPNHTFPELAQSFNP